MIIIYNYGDIFIHIIHVTIPPIIVQDIATPHTTIGTINALFITAPVISPNIGPVITPINIPTNQPNIVANTYPTICFIKS